MLKQTRLTILLSLNAVAILIAGILIANALGLNRNLEFTVVDARSDVTTSELEVQNILLDSEFDAHKTIVDQNDEVYYAKALTGSVISEDAVPRGELWNESAITIYRTGDIDICVGGGLKNLGKMYWQTSNTDVISGFYATARTWLGYDSATCKFPMIVGTGTTTITAGTYDGARKDSIVVTVVEPPVDVWKREVLELVNTVRQKNGLKALTWGETCANAAQLRAVETEKSYSHTRPNGTSWSTACPIPEAGGASGENLAAGNAAVSPATTVALWMNSEKHRENILSKDFSFLAVGFAYDEKTQYKTYWSQYFSTY